MENAEINRRKVSFITIQELSEHQREKIRKKNFKKWKEEMEENYKMFVEQKRLREMPDFKKLFEKAKK